MQGILHTGVTAIRDRMRLAGIFNPIDDGMEIDAGTGELINVGNEPRKRARMAAMAMMGAPVLTSAQPGLLPNPAQAPASGNLTRRTGSNVYNFFPGKNQTDFWDTYKEWKEYVWKEILFDISVKKKLTGDPTTNTTEQADNDTNNKTLYAKILDKFLQYLQKGRDSSSQESEKENDFLQAVYKSTKKMLKENSFAKPLAVDDDSDDGNVQLDPATFMSMGRPEIFQKNVFTMILRNDEKSYEENTRAMTEKLFDQHEPHASGPVYTSNSGIPQGIINRMGMSDMFDVLGGHFVSSPMVLHLIRWPGITSMDDENISKLIDLLHCDFAPEVCVFFFS